MARAETVRPSIARRLPFAGMSFARRAIVSGHARLLAQPAYQRLLAAEPFLRKLIPVLIVIFLLLVGLARFVELSQLRSEREYEAREALGMMATVLANAIDQSRSQRSAATVSLDDLSAALGEALPPAATGKGRHIYLTDRNGTIVATAPRAPEQEGLALTRIIGEGQPLTTFGARAGVLEIPLADQSNALATLRFLADGSSVAVVQPMENVYDDWRADV